MKIDGLKNTSEKILSFAGVKINGNNPWDIKVNNEKFYQRVLTQGLLGLGESYMDDRRCNRGLICHGRLA